MFQEHENKTLNVLRCVLKGWRDARLVKMLDLSHKNLCFQAQHLCKKMAHNVCPYSLARKIPRLESQANLPESARTNTVKELVTKTKVEDN